MPKRPESALLLTWAPLLDQNLPCEKGNFNSRGKVWQEDFTEFFSIFIDGLRF